ncbi:hypothetical protein FOG48_00622 [Hanseniaspora uvarum]|nr:hypothetical protein FOG48_00622 [Hanseniaspora uvarum]
MNSLTTEPNPFELSFKNQAKDSSTSLSFNSIDNNLNNIVSNMDTPGTSLVKAINKDQPHNISKNIINSNLNGEENKTEAPAFNSETPRSALFMQYIAQDNNHDSKDNQNMQSELVPVKNENSGTINTIESNNNSGLESKNSKESLLPENGESIIPPSIDNTVAAKNKAVQNISVFKDQLSAGGLSNGLVSPWPFNSQPSNISPGLTTPGGRKIKYDIFNGNLPNLNSSNPQQSLVNQQISNLKSNQGKVKLTPGPNVFNVDNQKSTLSPQDDFTKQMINNNSYFPTVPRSTHINPNERQNTSTSINQQNGFSLSMIQGDRLASNSNTNGLNSPGSFFNNMGFGNSAFQNMYFGNIVSPIGNMRTGLTPKIPQPSGLSSNVVSSNQNLELNNNNKNISETDIGGLTGPTNINSVNSMLSDGLPLENNYVSGMVDNHSSGQNVPGSSGNSKKNSVDNVEFAKEIKNEILQRKNSKTASTTGTKKRGRKPGKMKAVTTRPTSISDMDNMTITDIKHHPDLTEEEKKKGILEKNRIAAYNFRQRKKEFIKTLEKKVEFFEKEYEELSEMNDYLMGSSDESNSQVGVLFQLQSVLGDNEMAKAITAQIIHKIQNTSYQKRHGENPFSYLDDETYEPQS